MKILKFFGALPSQAHFLVLNSSRTVGHVGGVRWESPEVFSRVRGGIQIRIPGTLLAVKQKERFGAGEAHRMANLRFLV